MKQFYQGDVSLISGVSIPKEVILKPIPKNGVIVAEGEITGHNHLITKERENVEVEFGQDEKGFYFKIANGSAVIKHQEHAPITLNPGTWFVAHQWEYSELEDRRVQD